jgi:hypothetical protein
MYDEAELRSMSPQQRASLARALASLAAADHAPEPASQRRRRLVTAAAITCAVTLAAWIGWLAVSLPRHFRADGWQAAWIGFDGVLLLAFLATAWAAWRQRQVLIGCLVVLATLLCCDAWFDITLDWNSKGFLTSVLLAVLAELPLAVAAMMGARRLIRVTISRAALEGIHSPVTAFWRVPLFGGAPVSYRELLRQQPPPDVPSGTDGTGPARSAGPGAESGSAGPVHGAGGAGNFAGAGAGGAGTWAAAGAGPVGAGAGPVGAGAGPVGAGAVIAGTDGAGDGPGGSLGAPAERC